MCSASLNADGFEGMDSTAAPQNGVSWDMTTCAMAGGVPT